jgi:phosphoglycolate phosphatase-like HAD superfamily hydrolase
VGYSDAETASILAEIGLLQINHSALDAGEPFTATLEVLIKPFPRHAEFIRAFDERWVEQLGGAIPATVAILKALKEAGVPVHVISNYNREKFDIARRLYRFLDAFDELIVSGDVRPTPRARAVGQIITRLIRIPGVRISKAGKIVKDQRRLDAPEAAGVEAGPSSAE